MAVSSSALTMAQYALLSNRPAVAAVTYSLIDNGSIMARDIPFTDAAQLTVNGIRWEGNLPSVNWTNVNEEGSVVSGTPTPWSEQAFIMRNLIDVDKFIVEDRTRIADPRVAQVGAYLKAVSYDFNDKFINNTAAANSKAIVGLRSRLDNTSVYGVRSENKIDAGAVVMTTSATAANFATYLEYVDQLLWSVDSPDGSGVVLYANDQLLRRWDRLARQYSGQGGFSTATDQLGRGVTMYKNAVIRDAGYKADQSTRIITSTETSAGVDSNSTYTSLYAVNYTAGHLGGWQFGPMVAQDLGLLEGGSTYRTLIDWAGGIYTESNRSIGRVYGIKLA